MCQVSNVKRALVTAQMNFLGTYNKLYISHNDYRTKGGGWIKRQGQRQLDRDLGFVCKLEGNV